MLLAFQGVGTLIGPPLAGKVFLFIHSSINPSALGSTHLLSLGLVKPAFQSIPYHILLRLPMFHTIRDLTCHMRDTRVKQSLNNSLILYKCDLIPIFWLVSYLTTRHWKYNENVHDNSQTTISSLRIALCEKWTLKIKMAGVKSKKRALKQLKYKTQNTSTGTCFVHL